MGYSSLLLAGRVVIVTFALPCISAGSSNEAGLRGAVNKSVPVANASKVEANTRVNNEWHDLASGSETMKRWNLTKEDLRKALALMIRWAPELAEAAVINEPLIIDLAWTGAPIPSDAPVINVDKSIVAQSKQEQHDNQTVQVQMTRCQSKVMNFVQEILSFAVTVALNVQADVPWLVQALQRSANGAMRRLSAQAFNLLIRLGKKFISAVQRSSWTKAGEILFDMFKQLWESDVFGRLIEAAKATMTPWDWFTRYASLVATLMMWVSSGGLAFAVTVLNAVMRAGNLIQAGKMVQWYC